LRNWFIFSKNAEIPADFLEGAGMSAALFCRQETAAAFGKFDPRQSTF